MKRGLSWLVLPALVASIAVLALVGGGADAQLGYGPTTAPGTGYAATVLTIDAGQSVTARTSDAIIRFATTDAGATASLPVPSYIAERHTAVWVAWSSSQTAPVVNVGDAGVLILVADAGLVDATVIAPVGASRSFTWTGSEWSVSP